MDEQQTMQGKVVLLTGGNSGIGQAAAGQLARMGATVVITARSEAKANKACAEILERYGVEVDYLLLDLADFASIRTMAGEFNKRYARLDVLINNAGLNLSERAETLQGFEYVLGVNHIGPFLLTGLLHEKLKASAPARVVCLSSAAHVGARNGIDWDDLQRTAKYGSQVYCQTKLGTIYWVQEMARRYRADGISAFAVNPRLVSTQFAMDGDTRGFQKLFFWLGRFWMLTPDEGAKTVVWAASAPDIETLSGSYLQDSAPRKPASAADDTAAAEKWWGLSEQWVANEHP